METISPEMHRCIENCLNCHAVCLMTATNHCLQVGGEHVEQNHFRLMLDCAEICQTAANFMLRNSPHHPHVCRECAEICDQCAESCSNLGGMEKCVDTCKECAESCRAMASALV